MVQAWCTPGYNPWVHDFRLSVLMARVGAALKVRVEDVYIQGLRTWVHWLRRVQFPWRLLLRVTSTYVVLDSANPSKKARKRRRSFVGFGERMSPSSNDSVAAVDSRWTIAR
jgi:hypothetical protein